MTRKGAANAFSTVRVFESLEEIPNVGTSLARSLEVAGIMRPSELKGKDPYRLYDKLCERTGKRHDPCVLDVFISAVRYMEGEAARPWWRYTPERKKKLSGGPRLLLAAQQSVATVMCVSARVGVRLWDGLARYRTLREQAQ